MPFFFFNDTATTEIYTLSLHDALPIWFAASQLGGKIDSDNPGSRFLIVLTFYLGHQAVYFAVARGLVRQPIDWHWAHELLGAVANALLAVILFAVLDRFRQRA